MRLVSGVNVDGGTRVRSRGGLELAPEIETQIHAILAPRSREAEQRIAREGGHVLRVRLDDGTVIAGNAKAQGIRRSRLAVLFPDLLYLEIDLEAGEVAIQAKARFLWAEGAGARGWSRWVDRFLRPIDRLLLGEPPEEGDPIRSRWRVCGLELCADAIGLAFSRSDAGAFVGAHAGSSIGMTERSEIVETIAVGTRSSPLSVCLYDKDAEIAARRKADVYREVHLAHGWDGEARRTRCEVRFTGVGLQWSDPDTGEIVDLRDPLEVARPETIALAWSLATHKRRMVIEDGATRRRRCPTDPRWIVFQRAAEVPVIPWTFRQVQAVSEETWIVRRKRARERALRGSLALAVLEGLGAEARAVERRLEEAARDGEEAEGLEAIAEPIEGMAIAAIRRAFSEPGTRAELARWASRYDETQSLTRDQIEAERAAAARFIMELGSRSRPPPPEPEALELPALRSPRS